MTLKIIGSSIKKEYVKCIKCEKLFVWLNVYKMQNELKIFYYAICRKCRLKKEKKL